MVIHWHVSSCDDSEMTETLRVSGPPPKAQFYFGWPPAKMTPILDPAGTSQALVQTLGLRLHFT